MLRYPVASNVFGEEFNIFVTDINPLFISLFRSVFNKFSDQFNERLFQVSDCCEFGSAHFGKWWTEITALNPTIFELSFFWIKFDNVKHVVNQY